MRLLKYLVAILILTLAIAMPARAADDAELRQMIGELGTAKGYSALEDVITKLAATGDGRLATMLNELGEGNLFVDGATSQVVIAKGRGNTLRTTDPLTGDAIGEADKSALDKIRVNNRLRRSIRDAISTLTLRSPDTAVRLAAAQTMINNPSADALEQLDAALAEETDKAVAAAYGTLGPLGFPRRSVFIIDGDGAVRYAHRAIAGLTFRPVSELVDVLLSLPH